MSLRHWTAGACAALFLLHLGGARAGMLDAMEKSLMPGELSAAHARFEDSCTDCHKFFGQEHQNKLCLDCHDHKNVADDINKGKGYHGRIPGVKEKPCRFCHSEHKGRKHSIVLLDKQTFDHRLTDFPLRGRHGDAPCQACHNKDKKTGKARPYHAAPRQCVKCHKEDDAHDGRLGKQCGSCHAQTRWQDFRFDHSVTKFKLAGKHKGVECRLCHPQDRYGGVPKQCVACHKGDDKHKGQFGKKCQDCHSESGWSSQQFDHNKDTDFSLKARHKAVACQQCHRSEGYKKNAKKKIKKLNTRCYACHRLQDEHKGRYGRKCRSCHTVKGWQKVIFKHQKTDFPLKGRHKKVACDDCHPGILYKEELKTDCFSCHREDDVHREKQGKNCQDCHNEKGWQHKVAFDHNLAKFPLLGAHAALACEECHDSGTFRDTKAACAACHRDDDVHERSLGPKCARCHYVGDWKAWSFDHDKQTDFELTGKHKGITCKACHREPVEDEMDMPNDCQDCHLQDDAHDGEFGRRCQRCHNTESFAEVRMGLIR